MLKIVCYGMGAEFDHIKNQFNPENVKLIAVLSRTSGKLWTSNIGEGYTLSPKEITGLEYDYVLIASRNYIDEMYDTLVSLDVNQDKIIFANHSILNVAAVMNSATHFYTGYYDKNFRILKSIFQTLPHDTYTVRDVVLKRQRLLKHFEFKAREEYVRVSTLELCAQEIRRKEICGEVAEIGVYRGDFAKLINELFPDKQLFLFDTFEEFDARDLSYEKERGSISDLNPYLTTSQCADTSKELVLSRMKYLDRVILKEGYFPDSAMDMDKDIRFAFVSLDVDLFMPTYEGLAWFYPRLSHGGYIMVHDYQLFSGVRDAVDKYCEEKQINFVPVSDISGSVILTK